MTYKDRREAKAACGPHQEAWYDYGTRTWGIRDVPMPAYVESSPAARGVGLVGAHDIWNPIDGKWYGSAAQMRRENEAKGYIAVGDQPLERKSAHRTEMSPALKREVHGFIRHCINHGVPERFKGH